MTIDKRLKIVDGGYLTWIYGSERFSQRAWKGVRSRFTFANRAFIVMEGGKLFRNDYYEPYKSKRTERREGNEKQEFRHENVRRFRQEFLLDKTMPTVDVAGHEADDLVAVTIVAPEFSEYWPLLVVGTDKDFLQLPNDRFTLERVNGFQVTLPHFAKSWPKTIQPHIRSEIHVLLTLSIMGDSSDSVPRLAPPRALKPVIEVLQSDQPFQHALDLYGLDFIRNLYLVMLPGPWVFDPIPTDMEIFNLFDDGMTPRTFSEYGLRVNSNIIEPLIEMAEKSTKHSLENKDVAPWIDLLDTISRN